MAKKKAVKKKAAPKKPPAKDTAAQVQPESESLGIETSQLVAQMEEIRQLENDIELKEKEIASRAAVLKDLRAEMKQLEKELRELIRQDRPKVNRQPTLSLGSSDVHDVDSPVEDLGLPKSVNARLKKLGMERIPDVGKLLRGQNSKYPNGIEDVPGFTETGCKKLKEAFSSWKSGIEDESSNKDSESTETDSAPSKDESSKPKPGEPDLPAQSQKGAPPNKRKYPDRATLTVAPAGCGHEIGDEIEGEFLAADQSFNSSTDFLFNSGEFELVKDS